MADRGKMMRAMLLTGHGGEEKLRFTDAVPVPEPGPDEVLIRVAASSVNNTDINTRIGWYAGGANALGADAESAGWGGSALRFPRIQGTDIAGEIVATGAGVSEARIGERVIVQPCLVSLAGENFVSPWIASEMDGGFAEYALAPSADCHAVQTALSDYELAALPCAYGTAANMVEQAGIHADDRVLITGASGNVGIAALLLSRLAGAEVHCVAAPEKWEALEALGAKTCYPRDLKRAPAGRNGFTAIIDLVGGENWPRLLDHLVPHGRLVISGAIGGAEVNLDLRKLYLNNWTLLGRTQQTRWSFLSLIDHVNAGRLSPPIHRVYPLESLVEAQREFLKKTHLGKIIIDVTA